MVSRKNLRFGSYSNTVTVFILAVLLAVLAITIRTMQRQTGYSQYAASGCITPPSCLIEHKCFIPQPREGWCPITPVPLSPTPSGY